MDNIMSLMSLQKISDLLITFTSLATFLHITPCVHVQQGSKIGHGCPYKIYTHSESCNLVGHLLWSWFNFCTCTVNLI